MTLRNLPPELVREIQRRARKNRSSLARAAIDLLLEGAGRKPRPGPLLFHDLDPLAGSWSDEEARAFEEALREQRAVDPELWR